jgi:hypothetical protein
MAINTHISNWIDRAELTMDYYTLFIKAWIPYNAWYMHNFYDEDSNPKRDRDAAIISHINSTSNRYRDKIKNLLRGTDDQSIEFRQLLGCLHFELDRNPIPDFENRISFSTINLIKNTVKAHSQHQGINTYFVEFRDQLPKTQKRWYLEVQKKRNNQTLHRIELHDWSLEELNNDPDYQGLPENEMRNQLRDAFQKINPKKPIVIILPPKRTASGKYSQPADSIIIDHTNHLYFTNDHDMVSKAIVQLLYELRCKLFHGELNPVTAFEGVYENAYRIQKILIKELR